MGFGRFHGRNISLINSSLSLIFGSQLAGTVTAVAVSSVYDPASLVTLGDYFGLTVNLSPRLTPDPGKFGGRTAVTVHQPQFAPPQRRIDARREQPSRGAMARLRQGSRDIRAGPERKRLLLAAVPVVVVPVPPALEPNEQIQTSAKGDLARVSSLPVDARTLARPFQASARVLVHWRILISAATRG